MSENNSQGTSSEWAKPPVIIALVGLILSLFANITQYNSASNEASLAKGQFDFSQSKWNDEREKLVAEIESLKNKENRISQDRNKINKELKNVKRDISTWDNALIKDKAELLFLQNTLSNQDPIAKKFMHEATQLNIEIQRGLISTKEAEKAAAVARRSELEADLLELH